MPIGDVFNESSSYTLNVLAFFEQASWDRRMYRDPQFWKKIRRRILVDGVTIRQVANTTGISRKTVRKILANDAPKPYAAPSRVAKIPHPRSGVVRIRTKDRAKDLAFDWMRAVLQGEIATSQLQEESPDLGDIEELTRWLYEGRLSDRNRSMVILANRHGIPNALIRRFLAIDRKTIRKYLALFRSRSFRAARTAKTGESEGR